MAQPPPDDRPVQTYEVLICAFTTVVIEARDQQQALDDAIFAADLGDCTLDEASVKLLSNPEDIETSKRHADRFVPIE